MKVTLKHEIINNFVFDDCDKTVVRQDSPIHMTIQKKRKFNFPFIRPQIKYVHGILAGVGSNYLRLRSFENNDSLELIDMNKYDVISILIDDTGPK